MSHREDMCSRRKRPSKKNEEVMTIERFEQEVEHGE